MTADDIKTYTSLLAEFQNVPIKKRNKTFMGVCQYPFSRFEEICSRVLAYYFNPEEDHGFRDLWLRAFVQSLNDPTNEYRTSLMPKIRLEEQTYSADVNNKRIDIIIETVDSVYAIENKIGASLYNNLDVYSEHIENTPEYKEKRKVKVVLTAHTLSPDEKQKANETKFKEVSYKTLFENVQAILGDYVTSGNNNQLSFMLDFMNTLNNKMNFMENKERAEFFAKYQKDVEKLTKEFNEWKAELFGKQKERIAQICEKIREKTSVNRWWLWEEWCLGINFNEGTNERIGIVANFETEGADALAKFKIFITTWQGCIGRVSPKQCWAPYKDAVMKKYEGCYLDEGDKNDNHRVYVLIADIDGNDETKILETLEESYDFLKGLVDEREKNGLINK